MPKVRIPLHCCLLSVVAVAENGKSFSLLLQLLAAVDDLEMEKKAFQFNKFSRTLEKLFAMKETMKSS